MNTLKKKILVADDDRVILLTLAEGLTKAGYLVIAAQSGKQALALSNSEHPDLALLDICMPDIDGIALAQSICQDSAVPFVFLSAYDDEGLAKRAVEAGALGYLVKPQSLPAILLALRVALARAEEIASLRQREQQLERALASNRIIATAVGILMRENQVSQQEGFERLRRLARDRRLKLEDLARTLVAEAERPD